jgi:hypothetical protein
MNVVDISILGNKNKLKSKVAELGIASFDFSKVKIINPIES